MRNRRYVFVPFALLAFSAAASAQSRETGWEFGADLLYQDSVDVDFDGGTTAAIDSDLGLALSFGYRFNSRWELQFGLDWQSIDYDAHLIGRSDNASPIFDLEADVSGELEIFTPRVSGSFNFLEGSFTPFVTAGVGWNFIDTNIPTSRVQVGCWWDPWWGYICTPYQSTRSTDAFGALVGAGARWDAGDAFSLRFSYERHWSDLSDATSTVDLDQLKLGFYYRY